MKKNINIQLDTELWQAVKVEAARQNKTLQEFVSEILLEATLRNSLRTEGGFVCTLEQIHKLRRLIKSVDRAVKE